MAVLFKRKKEGGGPNWGAGWDDLLKDYWDDLDRIWEDNYYGRHDLQLIDRVFNGMEAILEGKAMQRIRKYCQKAGEDERGWANQIKQIISYFKGVKTTSDKVIAVNAAEQFLRAAEPDSKKVKEVLGKDG